MATFTGQIVITGDSTTSAFLFEHGLSSTPTPYFSFGDADTKAITADYGNFDLSADDTHVTLTFANAPTQGVVLTLNICAVL